MCPKSQEGNVQDTACGYIQPPTGLQIQLGDSKALEKGMPILLQGPPLTIHCCTFLECEMTHNHFGPHMDVNV